MFRGVLHLDPTDVEAYLGMGEAALALGNFRTARVDFANASRLRPGDTTIAKRQTLAESLLVLDPLARGIRSSDRVTRSRLLLVRTLQAAVSCGHPSARTDSARALTAPSPSGDSDLHAEAMLDAATELWTSVPPSCVATDKVLRLLQARLAHWPWKSELPGHNVGYTPY
jgi:hypothetical protein